MGIGNKDLEDVEALVLNHFSVVAEKIHANLQVFAAVDVGYHDAIVGAIQENLSEQFYGLALRNIAV